VGTQLTREANHYNAVIWKNGTPAILLGSVYNSYNATAIAISGNDVYVAGTETGYDNPFPVLNFLNARALYWKNGVPTYLTSDAISSAASSIAVSGNDVYVAGYSYDSSKMKEGCELNNMCEHYKEATYWKNGVPVFLTDGIIDEATADKIAVSGQDVYLTGKFTGFIDPRYTVSQPMYWKNGVMTSVSDYGGGFNVNVNDIAISGNDVYICGCNSLYESGSGFPNDYYPKALYWKNAAPFYCPDQTGAITGTARSIALLGNDVYTAGRMEYPLPLLTSAVKCWKNGIPIMTIDSGGASVVTSMCLVKK
jgi:hypothetical protein